MSDALGSVLSTVTGNYVLDANGAGEFDTIQRELDHITTTMYLTATQRLDYNIGLAVPLQAAMLSDSGEFAAMYGAAPLEHQRAVVGLSNAVTASMTTALTALEAGLPTSHRNVLLWAIEKSVYDAAAQMSGLYALTMPLVYEGYRKGRDTGLSYLFKDIEFGTKLRSIGDSLVSVSGAAFFAAAKDAISQLAHTNTMQYIEWDRNRRVKSLNSKASDIGSFMGMAVSGIADGYADSKAKAKEAATG